MTKYNLTIDIKGFFIESAVNVERWLPFLNWPIEINVVFDDT